MLLYLEMKYSIEQCYIYIYTYTYRIAQNFETLANQSFQSFGEENVGEFTIASISYFSESRIWLGKILATCQICQSFPPKFYINYILYTGTLYIEYLSKIASYWRLVFCCYFLWLLLDFTKPSR